jgi:hypothetical protein
MLSQKTWVLLFCAFAILVLIGVVSAQISNSGSSSVIELEPIEEEDLGFFLWDFILDLFKPKPKSQASIRLLPINQEIQEINLIGDLSVADSEIIAEDLVLSPKSSSKSSKKSSSKKSPSKKQLPSDDGMQDEIIVKNGIKYIIRDGEEYLLSPAGPTTSDYYIEFDPALPNAVCEYEEIDITVKGYGSYNPTLAELALCGTQGYLDIGWCVKLMEDDLSGDDEISYLCDTSRAYASVEYPFCNRFYFQADFEYVDLSAEIIPDPGSNGEFYAKIYDLSDQVDLMSTDSFDVYAYVDGECECIEGACCDLAGGRPYDLKPSGSQPTGYEDSYYCSDTNSPIGTNYVRERNWYCNGVDWTAHYTDTNVDTCGYCEYCTHDDPTCNYYSQGTPCGSGMICDGGGSCVTDCECSSGVCCDGCDYRPPSYVCDGQYSIDYGCPDGEGNSYPGSDVYKRVKKRYCSGSSSSCTGSISDWFNWVVYDSCSSDEYCTEDDPSCNSCGYHIIYTCYDNDVYWYDFCFNREDKKQECGDDEYGDNYCYDNDVYRDFIDRGCSTGSCFETTTRQKVEECGANGCSNGQCIGDIECYSNSDCGTDAWVGSAFCFDNDVYQNWRTYTCSNPGTPSSYCSYNDVSLKREDCSPMTPCIQRICAGEIFEQALSLGWNDVTFNTLLPLDNSIENVLASIEGKYDNVWAYVDGEWLSYSPTVLPSMNTLLYIEEGMTISIEMNQAATLSFVYFPGNLYDINDWCELGCATYSVYDFCTRQYDLEIEGEILEGTCDYFVTEHPVLGIQPCENFDCP